MKRINHKIEEGSWVIRKSQLDFPVYGKVEIISGDLVAGYWGWRIGGMWGAIDKIDDLLPVAPPSEITDFARKIVPEKLKEFKKEFGAEYAYDAAAGEIMKLIYKLMYQDYDPEDDN